MKRVVSVLTALILLCACGGGAGVIAVAYIGSVLGTWSDNDAGHEFHFDVTDPPGPAAQRTITDGFAFFFNDQNDEWDLMGSIDNAQFDLFLTHPTLGSVSYTGTQTNVETLQLSSSDANAPVSNLLLKKPFEHSDELTGVWAVEDDPGHEYEFDFNKTVEERRNGAVVANYDVTSDSGLVVRMVRRSDNAVILGDIQDAATLVLRTGETLLKIRELE